MFRLNPLTVRKLKRFREIRRGYYSAILLVLLTGTSLFAELMVNDKAIIVAGYGPHPSNWLWDETKNNADFAYKALRWQGYTHDEILYLSSVEMDLDGDFISIKEEVV